MTSTAWRRVPGSSRFVVPPGAGRSARHLRALAGTSDWRRSLVDRCGLGALTLVGPAALPSAPPLAWPPLDPDELVAALRTQLAGLRVLGGVVPRQRGRDRLSLLARLTGNLVVIKLGGNDGRLERERAALELLTADPLPGIATPAPLAHGVIAPRGTSYDFLVTATIAVRRQRAAIDEPLRTFENDLADRLGALPRPDGAGGHHHLVPVHGDLTPWNLRRTGRGLALFDWESAGWGPPGSDLDHYRTTSAHVRPWWSSGRQHGPGSVRAGGI